MAAVPKRDIKVITMVTTDCTLSQLRLLHLVSPSLPIGGFTYSQGLEWAVECSWVTNEAQLLEWLNDLLTNNMVHLEIPILARLYKAFDENNFEALTYWSHYLIASRETRELREEERNRGRALASLLPKLGIAVSKEIAPLIKGCQSTGFAQAAHFWNIPLAAAAAGFIWGWLENITLVGVKIVPLGQTAGQKIIAQLTANIPDMVKTGLQIEDDSIGNACPALAIASTLHETQYTRIYRS
jgi:urease accessory protein